MIVPPLQTLHGPPAHAVSQQYPSTQWPEAHSRQGADRQSLATPQVAPSFFCARHTPREPQYPPAAQSASDWHGPTVSGSPLLRTAFATTHATCGPGTVFGGSVATALMLGDGWASDTVQADVGA